MSRYERLRDEILRKHRHASEEELISFLDGELPRRQAEWLRRHLESCWSCRAACERITRTVGDFMEYRERLLSQCTESSGNGWLRLEARLRTAGAPAPKQSRALRIAPALVLLAVVAFVYFRLTSPAPVSADAVIENARASEERSTLQGELVLYRKLQVRRRIGADGSAETATYEVWTDSRNKRVRHSGPEKLWIEVRGMLAANQRAEPPLSPAGFERWRRSVRNRRETVMSGSELLTVKTQVAGPLDENRIREGRFTVRTADWTPVSESILVHGGERERLYEFEALESRVGGRHSMPADQPPAGRTPLPEPPSRIADAASENGEAHPASASLLDEIAAHYALHRAGACRDGAIEVIRDPEGLLVRGVAETQERKAELAKALAAIPSLKVDLVSVEEAAVRTEGVPLDAAAALKVESHASAVAEHLSAVFAAQPGPGSPSERVAAFADRIVSSARDLRREAWALRRLAERFSGDALLPQSAPSRWLVEVMLRDHLKALETAAVLVHSLVDPVLHAVAQSAAPSPLGEADSPSSWGDATFALFDAEEKVQSLIHSLFAASREEAAAAHEAADMQFQLTLLDRQIRRLSEQVSREFLLPTSEELIP